MRTFDYTSAETIEDALGAIGAHGAASTRLLAGGTDLLTLMKAGIVAPEHLVDIKRAGISSTIEETDDGLTIGALAPLADIETHPRILAGYSALAEAAAVAATPQLRNMATIGGNLLQRPRCWYFRDEHFHCWLKGGDTCFARDGENRDHAIFDRGPCVAVHPSDLATALLALNASVRIVNAEGERVLPLSSFFTFPSQEHRTETTLQHGDLLLAVSIPPPGDLRSTYLKAMERKAWSFALIGVAAVLAVEGERITDARLALGGVAPIPLRMHAAEQALVGERASSDLFQRAADSALAEAAPLEHNGYKVPLAHSLIRRALGALVQASPPRQSASR